ncbi:distal membrane-arm assembly complex protein 2 isoform X3 [Crotalus tigris]|uniref:distal membrane-arm assembly complex protein 2 isoform X3 n=1 Tax=Crotalus tigris TaxID=88082 RepID=UPI00192F9824|nr:distal membrane-arm assembly complex protein 2 isoform X3 [Crotalus tigris]
MAAPMLLRQSKRLTSLSIVSSRLSSTSGGLSSSPRKSGIFHFLTSRFYDIESFVEISQKLKRWKMEKGNNFQDQMDWYRVDSKEEEGINFLEYCGKSLEAIDLSGSVINYIGLKNFGNLTGLKHLDLSRCSFIDDWCLSQLHPFAESLQTLSLAGCSRITEKGLTCLHHFQNLERLDVSSLPSVPHPLLIRILLEEMLPQCYIVGMDNHENMDFPTQREKERTF